MKKEIVNSSYQLLEFFAQYTEDKKIEFCVDTKLLDSMGYKAFVDIAQIYKYKMLTPKEYDEGIVEFSFVKLDPTSSFHQTKNSQEKYGLESEFFGIDKNSPTKFSLPLPRSFKVL